MSKKDLSSIIYDAIEGSRVSLDEGEIEEIRAEILEILPSNTADLITVDPELLREAYQAVVKLKDRISRTTPTDVDDVLAINELGTLEFKLSELLNNRTIL